MGFSSRISWAYGTHALGSRCSSQLSGGGGGGVLLLLLLLLVFEVVVVVLSLPLGSLLVLKACRLRREDAAGGQP
jgi:hypothetical protein